MNKWQAIVFDMDDTLYPEQHYVLSGFRAVADWMSPHLGIDADQGYADLEALFHQGVRGDTFNRWLASYAVAIDDWIKPLIQVYREHDPQIEPFPDLHDLLPRLRERARLAVITDGYLPVQQKKWAALGLADYFDAVIFSDAFGREGWKPNPQPFEAVQQALNCDPACTVYIADNPKKDFLGARRAGWQSIGFQHEAGEYCYLEPETPDHQPDRIIQVWHQLEATLEEMERNL